MTIRRHLVRHLMLPLVALIAIGSASAHPHHDGEVVAKNDLTVSHAYTAASTPTAHGIHVYLTIENSGAEPDRLIEARVPFADPARFEANVIGADGALEVRTVPAIVIDGGQALTLQPGSARLVFDDVSKVMRPGELFALTLTFERAGTIEMIGEVGAREDGAPDEPSS